MRGNSATETQWNLTGETFIYYEGTPISRVEQSEGLRSREAVAFISSPRDSTLDPASQLLYFARSLFYTELTFALSLSLLVIRLEPSVVEMMDDGEG